MEGPFSREWYFGERVVRQSLQSAEFIVPHPPPIGIRYTDTLSRAHIQRSRRGFRIRDFLGEGDYDAFVTAFLMRPFFEPPPVPAPRKHDHDEAGPSQAVPDDELGDELTEDDWRVTVTDIYGDQFTHHFQPVPEVDSSGRPAEVSIGSFILVSKLIFYNLSILQLAGQEERFESLCSLSALMD